MKEDKRKKNNRLMRKEETVYKRRDIKEERYSPYKQRYCVGKKY